MLIFIGQGAVVIGFVIGRLDLDGGCVVADGVFIILLKAADIAAFVVG